MNIKRWYKKVDEVATTPLFTYHIRIAGVIEHIEAATPQAAFEELKALGYSHVARQDSFLIGVDGEVGGW